MAYQKEVGAELDCYVNEDTAEVTARLTGKDAILLNADKVYTPVALLTTAQDLAGAINELFTDEGGGGESGKLKAVIDDGASSLKIVLNSGGELTEHNYGYSAKTISSEIKTSYVSGDTTSTRTVTFNKYLVDALYGTDGQLILQAVYSDESKGIVSHYLDADGNIIYIDGGYADE